MNPSQHRRNRRFLISLTCLAVFGGLLAMPAHSGFSAVDHGSCEALTKAGLFDRTTIASAEMAAADTAKKLPAYCEGQRLDSG